MEGADCDIIHNFKMESEGSNDDGFPTNGGDAMQFGEEGSSDAEGEEMSQGSQEDPKPAMPQQN